MIDDGVTWAVELGAEGSFGDRHSDGIGKALTQRTGRCLHSWRDAKFGMAWSFRVKLAEALELAHWQIIASEMKQRVEQHRGVAVRQHKTITIGPRRIFRIVAQMVAPEHGSDF